MSLFNELARRNVIRVGAAYVVVAWLVIQVVETIFPAFGFGDAAIRYVTVGFAVGLMPALVFAWAFEITPEGLKWEKDVDRSQSITARTAKRVDRVIMFVLALALGYFAFDKFVLDPARDAEELAEATQEARQEGRSEAMVESYGDQSIAVLPFINMSDDPGNEYFSDGISEELLNLLAQVPELRVASRSSAFYFKGKDVKITDVAEQLNVNHVLEGSVRKAGSRVRITAQLIDAHSDTHLWSETYTRELDDIFALQDNIAGAIVKALKVTLTGEEQNSADQISTDNAEAYNLYLLGRHIWKRRVPGTMRDALPPLEEAVRLDPEFDRAWAAIADAYLLMSENGESPQAEVIPKARAAVNRALTINPDSAAALTSSAMIRGMYEYDWATANAEFRRAIELDPTYVTARQWYAETLAVQQRIDEALAQIDAAIDVDPLYPNLPHVAAWIAVGDGRLDEAEDYILHVLKLDPNFANTISMYAVINRNRGNFDEALRLWRQYEQLVDGDIRLEYLMIQVLKDPGNTELEAAAIEANWKDRDTSAMIRALRFAWIDRYDLALDALETQFAIGDALLPHINRMVIFDPIRDDPRFQAMLREMNLLP